MWTGIANGFPLACRWGHCCPQRGASKTRLARRGLMAGKSQAAQAAQAVPTNLRFDDPTDSSCIVRWDASDGAFYYYVRYRPAVGGRWTNEPHGGKRIHNNILDLEPGTEYSWAVRAVNSGGVSGWALGPNFTTAPEGETMPPGSPEGASGAGRSFEQERAKKETSRIRTNTDRPLMVFM